MTLITIYDLLPMQRVYQEEVASRGLNEYSQHDTQSLFLDMLLWRIHTVFNLPMSREVSGGYRQELANHHSLFRVLAERLDTPLWRYMNINKISFESRTGICIAAKIRGNSLYLEFEDAP